MKKEFPEWVYVNPEASGSTDVSIVDKADHVYFFTDTISHSKYYQFMNVVSAQDGQNPKVTYLPINDLLHCINHSKLFRQLIIPKFNFNCHNHYH